MSERGELLWEPSPEAIERSSMTRYMRWLESRARAAPRAATTTRSGAGRPASWRTSGARSSTSSSSAPRPPTSGCSPSAQMPGAVWCPGARLNYAENLIAGKPANRLAVQHASELRELDSLTWGELREQVARVASALRALGVEPGDRVVAYMPNLPETLVAFLACASIGAVWSSCSPDFGASSVIDRFAQIEPKLLLCVDGYRYNGRDFDRTETVAGLLAELPTVERTIVLPYLAPEPELGALRDPITWARAARLRRSGGDRVRAGRVRPPALGPLLLRHHRAAEGDRPGPRRDPARAGEEARPAPRRAGRRPRVLVHDDRLDDVELPRRRAAHRGLDRPL